MTDSAENRPTPHGSPRLGIWGAVFLTVVAVGALIIATGYSFGTPRRMGAGFFPVILSVLLICLAVALAIVTRHEIFDPVRVRARPILCILGAILLFGLLIRPFGLVPAVLVSVPLAAFAEAGRKPLATAGLAVGIAALLAGVFVFGLNVPIDLFWW